MKLLLPFLSLLLLSLVPLTAASPAPAKKGAKAAPDTAPPAPAAPAPAAPPAPAPATPFALPKYLEALKTGLKLTDDEQKQVLALYVADGPTLHDILNNDALSPLAQAQKVSDLRDTRNGKIAELLQDSDQRRRDFVKIEAKYRVALTELAADGGLVAPPEAPAPAAADTTNAPAASAPAAAATPPAPAK